MLNIEKIREKLKAFEREPIVPTPELIETIEWEGYNEGYWGSLKRQYHEKWMQEIYDIAYEQGKRDIVDDIAIEFGELDRQMER